MSGRIGLPERTSLPHKRPRPRRARGAPGLPRPVGRPARPADCHRAGRGASACGRAGGPLELVDGKFFAAAPPGADAYLLSRVPHDWDDGDAGRIVATCRDAMTANSRLILVEALLPERAREQPGAIRMDLHMMLLLGSRERSEAQFRHLLAGAGLDVRRVTRTA